MRRTPPRKEGTICVFDEDYLKITGKEESIVELLAMPEAADIDFEPPRLHCAMYKTADLFYRTTIT